VLTRAQTWCAAGQPASHHNPCYFKAIPLT
jgi:hypothetical protein